MTHTPPAPRRGWASRWTFVLAATGSAVGLGNIWKFPYITGENGGGAFVLVYLACILLVGIPVMIAEILLGRAGRRNPIDSMRTLAATSGVHPFWQIIGISGVVAGLMILSFYSVIAGWALDYIPRTASGSLAGANAAAVADAFAGLQADGRGQLIWHTAFIAMTVIIIAFGVSRGIGGTARTLMPVLFVLLLLLLGYSLAYGDFAHAVRFLFAADFSRLSASAVLIALGHAFFTLSLGMGAIMAYGAYMPPQTSIAGTALIIAALDTAVALVAGLAIFPLVFAHQLAPAAGPGLMFVTLPIAFADMTGGLYIGTAFFLLLSIAALTSAISLLEPGVAWLSERGRLGRLPASLLLGGIAWLGGIACIHSGTVFNALDFTATNILLPTGGLLIALFAGWRLRPSLLQAELGDLPPGLFRLWCLLARVIAPLGVGLVLLSGSGLLRYLWPPAG